LKQYQFDAETAEEVVSDGKYIIEQYKCEKMLALGNSKISNSDSNLLK
jgi:hypothetical protein